MKEYLTQLVDSTSKGLKELSEHPIQYTSHAVKDVVLDYWDLAGAVASGFALCNFNSEHFGIYRDWIVLGGFIGAGLPEFFGSKDNNKGNRSFRNLDGFLSGLAFSWMYNSPDTENISTLTKTVGYCVPTVFAGGSIFEDKQRRNLKSRQEQEAYSREVENLFLDEE